MPSESDLGYRDGVLRKARPDRIFLVSRDIYKIEGEGGWRRPTSILPQGFDLLEGKTWVLLY
jgi:hypothetical protein